MLSFGPLSPNPVFLWAHHRLRQDPDGPKGWHSGFTELQNLWAEESSFPSLLLLSEVTSWEESPFPSGIYKVDGLLTPTCVSTC